MTSFCRLSLNTLSGVRYVPIVAAYNAHTVCVMFGCTEGLCAKALYVFYCMKQCCPAWQLVVQLWLSFVEIV